MGEMKEVQKITGPKNSHWVGDGFPVRQMFGYNDLGRELSPFLLLDYAGPHEFTPAAQQRGVGAHPHRGFETVTIVYQGEVEHRDTMGHRGKITPGDVQWMTAGAGVLHEEMHSQDFTQKGGTFELVQLWVNLPARSKMTPPRYQTLSKSSIPVVTVGATKGSSVRVIAGEFLEHEGPAQTHTPINIWDVTLKAGDSCDLLVPAGHLSAVFCAQGNVSVCDKDELQGPKVVTFGLGGESIRLEATSDARVLFLGGAPITEPVVGQGPFVMNTEEELRQAFKDYENGSFGVLE
jgi:quercetin 2,3-dioxygenase